MWLELQWWSLYHYVLYMTSHAIACKFYGVGHYNYVHKLYNISETNEKKTPLDVGNKEQSFKSKYMCLGL